MKKQENKEEKKIENSKQENSNTALIIVFSIAGLIILACIIAVIFRYNSNSFKYEGIEFDKVYMGNIAFYTAKIPVTDDYGKITRYQNIDFRNDPRTLNDLTVNTSGNITFVDNKLTYISYGLLNQCGDNGLAATNLGLFMSLTDTKYKGAVDDSDYKNSTNSPYVNCQTHPNNTVVLIKAGNETKIEQTNTNCYELVFKDCEILKATEKFELTILEQYIKGLATN